MFSSNNSNPGSIMFKKNVRTRILLLANNITTFSVSYFTNLILFPSLENSKKLINGEVPIRSGEP